MENWVSVFTTTRELEAGIVKDLLDEAGIPAVILNQKTLLTKPLATSA